MGRRALHHRPYRSLPHLRSKPTWSRHGPVLSRLGVSGKLGAVHGTPRGRRRDAPGRWSQEDRPMGASYVGLDVHSQFSAFMIQDDTGTIVARGTVPTTPERFAGLCQAHQLPAGATVAAREWASSFYCG